MQYAKTKRVAAGAAELINESELNMVQKGTGQNKRDQLAFLNRKVKQFEEKVARDEMLMRNGDRTIVGAGGGIGGNTVSLDAQSQVNDNYLMAIEAKLKILNQL